MGYYTLGINPDIFGVFGFEIELNTKFAEFGSAQNVNLLVTNMIFTKGIGTPKYKSPEVLNIELNKKMFLIGVYLQAKYLNIFNLVADFISSGGRSLQCEDIKNEECDIIKNIGANSK
ncbi:protein serine/threonine kinase, putative [Entamoeba invadens IP1]|uniref:Protein serine/threonine kinase, putative n=1 Tax=Entamoeba invadens IP1 TaxID=370355 RepID=L7FNA9_ENTIV|nr:protein serine/threonine kinase, putative [Entamoeba invadens IP1]ELP94389.1 protein serine/threonine kinase, putative [Entamoeba invadens IP1]|eukprot:XP_004261160.1 protein serine/threonine kinase, putative [Entamoeba invadens IP1]